MPKICSLFSGSSGNSIYIENKSDAILIDAGVSAKRLLGALNEKNLDVEKIRAVFVTHEHSDHIKGISVFCKKHSIPVYLTGGTLSAMQEEEKVSSAVDYRVLSGETDMGSIGVSYFHTSHDAKESCGYVLDLGHQKVGVSTDLGIVTDEVHDALLGCKTVVIESNHDPNMLQNNSMYTFPLKRRIMSEYGHLSNGACAEEVKKLVDGGAQRILLAHLSRENNLPMLAKESTRSMLLIGGLKEGIDYLLSVCAPQNNDLLII